MLAIGAQYNDILSVAEKIPTSHVNYYIIESNVPCCGTWGWGGGGGGESKEEPDTDQPDYYPK